MGQQQVLFLVHIAEQLRGKRLLVLIGELRLADSLPAFEQAGEYESGFAIRVLGFAAAVLLLSAA